MCNGRMKKVRESCREEFEAHWKCLNARNMEYQKCRSQEKSLNQCIFQKLVIL